MKDSNYTETDARNVISVMDLVAILWNKKYFVISITSFVSIISVFIALSIPNSYTSKALLAPSNQNDSLSSGLGSYSALAGMAGINLGLDSDNTSLEAIERIRSFNFFSNYFLPNVNLEDLIAAQTWSHSTNSITYDNEIFDKDSNKWTRKVRPPKKNVPSAQEAFDEYKKILSISENKNTKFVNLSITHVSPVIAQRYLNIIIKNINESMREEDRELSIKSIDFLKTASDEAKLNSVKEAISKLLESQIQSLMLVSVNEDYVYKVIENPLIPEKKSGPSRAVICIIGAIFGFILSILVSVSIHFFRENP